LRIEHRFAGGDVSRIQAYRGAKPDLIVASSTPIIAALKQATQTIPIVFANVNDPVGQGFVANRSKPRTGLPPSVPMMNRAGFRSRCGCHF
jgi:putative tryptophan/tyrosine transport system substrate-binding protein